MARYKKLLIALFMSSIMILSAFSLIAGPSSNSMFQNSVIDLSHNKNQKEIKENLNLKNITNTGTSIITNGNSISGSKKSEAIGLSSDSMGNLFVLWSNGNVFERPDMGGSNWIYLGNASDIGSYNNGTLNLGTPVGIRASYNWENKAGEPTGMVVVLFSNGYASMATYGTNPIVWTLSKLPGSSYIALSYNLNGYSYIGAHNQVFYATQKDGITYGYSDRMYKWTPIIGSALNQNITATVTWSNNFSPPTTGTVVMLAISRNGEIFFAEGSTNPLQPMAWKSEGKINTTDPNFIGLTQTPNPSSCFYYYAIEGQKNSQLFASTSFNGTASSFNPISNTTTPSNQTAIQNKYFGFNEQSDELILMQNGQIYQTINEGTTYNLFSKVPLNATQKNRNQVMPWICWGLNLGEQMKEINETGRNYTMISYEFYKLYPNEEISQCALSTKLTNPSNLKNLTYLLHKYDLGGVPMITASSGRLIYLFTSNQYAMTLAINQMLENAVICNYTGYDIYWEPSSTNKTTGFLFDNFLNQFSLALDKFGKKLFVEVANWDPGFWNYTNLGRTNITSVNIMDYCARYQGSCSFTADLNDGLNDIPSGKLSISIIKVNCSDGCSADINLTTVQLKERFSSIEQNKISFIGIWVMPFNISMISQIEDFESNYTYSNYSASFTPGSSGIQVEKTGNAISGNIIYTEYKGDYIYGNSSFKTDFAGGTSLSSIYYNFTGSGLISIYSQKNNQWSLLMKVSPADNRHLNLPLGTTNVEFLYGNFTGKYIDQTMHATFNYRLDFKVIENYGWVNVYYQEGAGVKINGQAPKIVSIEKFGQWDIANVSLKSGNYNVSVERYEFMGYYDNIIVTSGHVINVYSKLETLLGKIVGTISPKNATLTINGNIQKTVNGQFSFCNIQANYLIQVHMNYYYNYSKELSIERGTITIVNINLSFLPPMPVQLKAPTSLTKPSFEITWTEFKGIDFKSYNVYLSTKNGTLGNLVYSTNTMNDTSYTFVNLSYSTTYYVTIMVKAQNGHSSSQEIKFTTISEVNSIASKEQMLTYYSYAIVALSVISILSLGGLVYIRFKRK